mmetsp:Transcript_67195/g.132538  ORF Transcript_67195/g.132538 Transcript_67195/m.132538 type:complete len:90 (-) Transcript_67195:401-670(-)
MSTGNNSLEVVMLLLYTAWLSFCSLVSAVDSDNGGLHGEFAAIGLPACVAAVLGASVDAKVFVSASASASAVAAVLAPVAAQVTHHSAA